MRGAAESSVDTRCPSCGGLVASDAEWCGQCYAPLRTAEPVRVPDPPAPELPATTGTGAAPELTDRTATLETPGGGSVEVAKGKATWDCPVCGERNEIQANRCAVCETPFARLFEQPEDRPEIAPGTAALWSLAFAGLGHWKAGARADGAARMVIFAWTLGTVLVILLSRSAGGLGRAVPLFTMYSGSAAGIYVLSAIDAHRLAAGVAPLVSSKVLLWASAALVLLSVAMATILTMPARG